MVPVGIKKIAPQHRGLGKKLVKEAEKITKREFSLEKIAVISGVGVRNYWRKLGYKLRETYMIKKI
jgi:elongator complex protein 3